MLALLAFVGFAVNPPAAPSADDWKLVFNEEFKKPGLPDPKKWGYEVGKVRNNELQYYTHARPQNSRVAKGKLVIEGIEEPYLGSTFTSASLTTESKFAFQYGRLEVLEKIPRARGAWPAIWLLGTDIHKVGWPRCGELDVMEYVGHIPDTIHGTVHGSNTDGSHFSKGGRTRLAAGDDQFHTYGMDWSKDRIILSLDSKPYFTFLHDKSAPWNFDRPMYLILNLAIGGSWGGEKGVDNAAFPQRFEIKSVKVFQHSNSRPSIGL